MSRIALCFVLAACTSDVTVLEAGDNAHELSTMSKSSTPIDGLDVQGVAIVGDLDGDGIDDLVITDADFKRPGSGALGAIYVVYGARPFPATIDLTQVPRLENDESYNPYINFRVVRGDFDGDGLADFAVVHDCTAEAPQTLGAYIVYGSRTRLSGSQTFTASGVAHLVVPNACDAAGAAVDLDGDGRSDLLLAASPRGPVNVLPVGQVYLLYGGARWTGEVTVPTQADAVLTQSPVGLGSLMAPIGDVDGDGHEDVFIADDGTYGLLYQDRTRKAYIIPGGATRLRGQLVASDLGTLVEGYIPPSGDRIVAKLGDLDGDGVDDFAVSSSREMELASLFYGRRGGFGPHIFTTQADAHLINHPPGGSGVELVGVGNIDGSGHPGLVVGDPERGDYRGAVYVLPGGKRYQGLVDVDVQSTVLYGGLMPSSQCGTFGPPAACAPEGVGSHIATGDLDGDGRPDLLSADHDAYGFNDSARLYVLDLGR